MAVRNALSSEVGVELSPQQSVLIRTQRTWPATETRADVSPYLTSSTKRMLDVVLAALLIIVLMPIMAMVAIGVRWSSPGCVVFRQKRHGWKQVPFEILKFRSMHAECGSDPTVPQARSCDPRVTSLGRLLRRTSIDELPQLFNVLRGEMSLIGPRPHALVHDERYLAELPCYGLRFSALPGLTGLAQVNGARGETPTLAHMQRRLQFDLEYIRTASLVLDVRILVLTAITMIRNRSDVY
jgi:putative colanic acid biosynthesis UDP-glucose lipid carrier transferase